MTEDDIKECFQNDRMIDNMKKEIKKSQMAYLVIWTVFLLFLLLFLETMTDNSVISLLLDKINLCVKKFCVNVFHPRDLISYEGVFLTLL